MRQRGDYTNPQKVYYDANEENILTVEVKFIYDN